MLEPQSTFLFVLLVIAFGALMWWMIRTRGVLQRVVAAGIAFLLAVQFGIMAVNRYFDYYQTWGAAVADLTNSGPATGPTTVSDSNLFAGSWRKELAGHSIYTGLAMREGYTFHLAVAGPLSHITREVYVYLPPEYFQPAYLHYRFPVIELIHGQPGEPQDWINVVGVTATLANLVDKGLAKPAVLIMPDANGGQRVSLQCLNQVGGPQDLTYLGIDLPDAMSHMLRVQPPGLGWGIAGYSEGGYCAANMALQPELRRTYGFAASLSGYFLPFKNQMPDGQTVDPFGGDKALRRQNSPFYAIQQLKPGARLPQFWLGAGKGDKADVRAAEYFWQELQNYEASVPVVLTPGQHTMAVWRAQIPPMLEWMTNGLAHNVAKIAMDIRLAAKQAARCAKPPAARPKTLASHARQQAIAFRPRRPRPHPSSSATCQPKPSAPAKNQAKHKPKLPVPTKTQAPT